MSCISLKISLTKWIISFKLSPNQFLYPVIIYYADWILYKQTLLEYHNSNN